MTVRPLFRSLLLPGIAAGSLIAAASRSADVPAPLILDGVFSDHMVMQRDMPLPVFGTAAPGSDISVALADGSGPARTAQGRCGADGRWKAMLPPVPAGGPYTLSASAGTNRCAITNVLMGDVWVCSGQSNMEWPLNRATNGQAEVAAARHPQMRLLDVPRRPADDERPIACRWRVCTPESAAGFSAVGYFFGRDLQAALKVPVGLIDSSWGGSPAEAWTPRSTLEQTPALSNVLARHAQVLADYPDALARYQAALAAATAVDATNRPMHHTDTGNLGVSNGWASADISENGWTNMVLPRAWEPVLPIDGAVWFRRTVELPPAWQGQPLRLSLGTIDDFDTTYVNGQPVGSKGPKDGETWSQARLYELPATATMTGRLVVAVRVFDHFGGGGFTGAPADLALIAPGGERLSLAGPWRYRVERGLNPALLRQAQRPSPPMGPDHPFRPAALYSGMIADLARLPIRGAIWYQGESNAGRAAEYAELLSAMVGGWRKAWNQPFPFLVVQLANFMRPPQQPEDSGWARLRDSQRQAVDAMPPAALITTIDVGEAADIHPRNKQEVGRRLALAARHLVHGEQHLVWRGPVATGVTCDGNRLAVAFDLCGSHLEPQSAVQYVAVAGRDGVFRWADSRVEGDLLIAASADVAQPVAIRYAWASNPAGANLRNREGLPAYPFHLEVGP